MLCPTYPAALQQAETLAQYYQSPIWVAQLRDGRFLVTLRPSALVGTNILRSISPSIISKRSVLR